MDDKNHVEEQIERQTTPEEQAKARQSSSLLNARNLLIAGISLVVMIVFVQVLAGAILAGTNVLGSQETSGQAAVPPPATDMPPGPRLQTQPFGDLAALRATEQANLDAYAWVDQNAGQVRIPIQRAMDVIAGRGLPVIQGSEPYTPTFETGEGGAAVPPPPVATHGSVAPGGSPEQAGAALFQQLGCAACHTAQNTTLAPTLLGLFGQQVTLQSGETVTADEAYIHESILNPQAKVVAGFQPVMPGFQGRVDENQLAQLTAYIQSLGGQ